MKTIHLWFSLAVVVAVSLVIGGFYPPAKNAHAEMGASEPLESIGKPKTNNVPTPNVEAQIAVPAQATQRVLSQHEEWMQAAGVPEADWVYAEDILNKESGWCPTKWEGEIGYCPSYHGVPTRGGYGLCQSTPPQKMAVMGEGWETDPVLQMKWCHNYALQYGSWAEAKKFRDCLGWCYSPRIQAQTYKVTTWF